MIPVWFIVIMAIAFSWLFVEMRIFIKAWNAYYRQQATQPLELATAKPDMPYHWKTAEQKEQCLMLCHNCNLSSRLSSWRTCPKNKERWVAWKLPARTIRAWGSTLNLTEGCNVQRTSLLKAIAREHKRKALPNYSQSLLPSRFIEEVTAGPSHKQQFGMRGGRRYYEWVYDYKTVFHDCLCGRGWLETHYQDECPEPTLEVTYDGKPIISVNGNYKRGSIKLAMKGGLNAHS